MEESHTAESAVRIEFEQRSRRKPRRPMGCCCCHFAAMSRDDHILAEEALLDAGLAWWRTIRPDGPTISYATTDVPLESVQTKRLFIHTVEYSCGEPKPGAPALVCLHGFGFGIGLYYAAAPALAERWPGRVFCIDLLGCGLSSRPAWPLPYGHRCPLDAAEAYFTDAIEAWRIQLGLDAIALLGHSISGYLAVAYAEQHPDHLERLILASPAGVPAPPPGLAEFHAQAPRVMRIVRMLFGRGWSPFFVAKDLGMGERALSGYITRRFGDGLAWIAKPELIKYLTGIWCRTPKSAGGYMHAALLTFGGIPEGSQVKPPSAETRPISACIMQHTCVAALVLAENLAFLPPPVHHRAGRVCLRSPPVGRPPPLTCRACASPLVHLRRV